MPREFAILRVERIKRWADCARLVDHRERKGQQLPTNVDPARQGKNRRLFPQASGAASAITRWHLQVAQRDSPLLTATDLRNLPVLAHKLKTADLLKPKNGVLKLIKENLSQTALAALDNYKSSRSDPKPLKRRCWTA